MTHGKIIRHPGVHQDVERLVDDFVTFLEQRHPPSFPFRVHLIGQVQVDPGAVGRYRKPVSPDGTIPENGIVANGSMERGQLYQWRRGKFYQSDDTPIPITWGSLSVAARRHEQTRTDHDILHTAGHEYAHHLQYCGGAAADCAAADNFAATELRTFEAQYQGTISRPRGRSTWLYSRLATA